MKNLKRLISLSAIFFILTSDVSAQCAMCRANAESNLKSGKNKIGRGLNSGILYLMSVPYLMGGVAAYIYFKHRKKE
ncbi:MAG: hypothetical protein ACHQNT_00680 [Bacteroidia bacterium]